MRGTLLIAAVLVLAGFVPLASGYHLSVGNQDAVLMAPQEDKDDPSVSADELARGRAETCTPYEADGSNPDFVAAAGADAFCGRLVYHAGTTFEQMSPADQDYPTGTPVGQFDVVYASYVGNYGLSTCIPWCFPPGGKTAFFAFHDTASQLGLADDGDTAWAGDDGEGWNEYAVNTLYPNALLMANSMTGLWEMNGWAHTVHDQQFIGFLNDADGEPIDQERLDAIVAGLKADGAMSSAAAPNVCAFTPDHNVKISAAQAGFCEVLFKWVEETEGGAAGLDGDFSPDGDGGYSNSCNSPAYFCGATQPAWYAQLVCKSAPVTASGWGCGGGPWFNTELPNLEEQPAWSDNDYDVWHFVVAPTVSECNGAQEPGFDTNTGTGMPYLAHDLDVYSPAATAAGVQSSQAVEDTARAAAEENIPGVDFSGPDTNAFIPSEVRKDDQVEPNADGDTSQSEQVIDRTFGADPCTAIVPSSETASTTDPWVDIIDSQVIRDATGDLASGAADPYLTEDDGQDASNRPGPFQYFTTGKVGIFTDKNDDGDYDQAPGDQLFTDIYSVGAYPLFWDLWLDESGQHASDAGCGLGFTEDKLSEEMDAAGYGTDTGLIQVVYLNEPTYWYNWLTSDVLPYPAGDTAFVFLSQGLRQQYNAGDAAVQGYVQDALDKLPTTPGNIALPGNDIGEQSDFYGQCGAGTGGFTSAWGFGHAGQLGGAGDTVVTEYVFEVTNTDGTIGGASIPTFEPGNTAHDFGTGIHQWFDVDPLDGDASRNTGNGEPAH